MKVFSDILHFLQLVFSFPVNFVLWIWNQPKRGRCFLWGMPAVLTLLFVLLVSIWARTGLKDELTRDYKRANTEKQRQIAKLTQEIEAIATADPSAELNRLATGGLEEASGTTETSARSLEAELSEYAVRQIRRNIRLRDTEEAATRRESIFEVQLQPDGRIDQVRLVTGSGDPVWDSDVEDGILETERLEFERVSALPDALELRFDRSEILLDRHELASQIYLRKLIELNPNDLRYKYDLALSLFKSGNQEQSLSLMSQVAPEDKPGLADAHVWLAETLYRYPYLAGDSAQRLMQRIEKHLEYALRSEPNHFDANFGMAQICYRGRRFAQAAEHLERILQNVPTLQALGVTRLLVETYKAMNEMQKLSERLSLIEERLKEFWQKDPENDQFVYDLCQLYAFRNHYQAAIDLLNEHTDEANRDEMRKRVSEYYRLWADWLQVQTPVDQAAVFDKISKAFEYNPRNDDVLTHLAVRGITGAPFSAEAKALYDPIADGDNAPALVLRTMGEYRFIAGDKQAGRELLEKSYARDPNDPLTANNLAYVLVTTEPIDAERALEMVHKVLPRIMRTNNFQLQSSLLHTRATALRELDRYQEAIASLQVALQRRPEHLNFMEMLRDLYREVDLTELADKMDRDIEAVKQKKAAEPPPPQ